MKKAIKQSAAELQGASAESVTEPDPVSVDVLCRRADRLIDSVRMMGEQVAQIFARPDRAVADANQAARKLAEFRVQVETALGEARQVQTAIAARMGDVQAALATVQNSAAGLVQRVQRARELTDGFGKLMDASAEKIASLESAADEARRAREAIGRAAEELSRVQQTAEKWASSLNGLTARHTELITSGNTAASRLRTLTDAGDRLREAVRQDIVALRELLRESRVERIAWEQLLARLPAAAPPETPMPDALLPAAASTGESVAATLAHRVRKIADFVRQSASPDEPTRPEGVAMPNRRTAGTAELSKPRPGR